MCWKDMYMSRSRNVQGVRIVRSAAVWGGGRTTPRFGLKHITVPTRGRCVDRGCEKGHGSMMFADGIVLCGDDERDMTEYMETWRRALEDRWMMISRPKTQCMEFNFGQDNGQGRELVKILGEELQRVHHFKYLGSSMEETGGMTTEITQRVSAAWRNWKGYSGVLCDRRMPVKLDGKV